MAADYSTEEHPMSDPYEALADELAAAAEAIRGLAGRGLPELSFVQLSIQPAGRWDNATVISMVDTVGRALLGEPGETHKLSGGGFHHAVDGQRGPLMLSVYQRVDPPEGAEVEAARQAKEGQ